MKDMTMFGGFTKKALHVSAMEVARGQQMIVQLPSVYT